MRKLVLFDIDGTLLLTAGAGRRALVAALSAEVGRSDAFDRIRFDGKTDPQIVAELLEAAGQVVSRESERVARLCRRYLEFLALELERPTTRTMLMPGVLPLLDRLESRTDAVLGLLTGNLEPGAALKQRRITAAEALAGLCHARSLLAREPHLLAETLRWVEATPAYRLAYGDLDRAIDWVLSLPSTA